MRGFIYWLVGLLGVTSLSALWVYIHPLDLAALPKSASTSPNLGVQSTNDVASIDNIKQWYTDLEAFKLWSFSVPKGANMETPVEGTPPSATEAANTTQAILVGITQTGKSHVALFMMGDKLERVGQGQSLSTGWKVKQIQVDRVTLEHTKDGKKEFRLFKGEE